MKKFFLVVCLTISSLFSFSFFERSKPSPAALAFPVAGKRSSIGSFWGDVRDGGARSHEGIDIFAKKGTPVVAVCDGVAYTGVGPRGGNYVWLRSWDYPWTAYYAHLDKHGVKNGQLVKKGDVLGTVGKTGNAKTTPPHLHFGIYTWLGAVNPLPYIKNSPKIIFQAPKQVVIQKKSKSTLKKTQKFSG